MRCLTVMTLLTAIVVCLSFFGAVIALPTILLVGVVNAIAQEEIVFFWPTVVYVTLGLVILSLAPRRLP